MEVGSVQTWLDVLFMVGAMLLFLKSAWNGTVKNGLEIMQEVPEVHKTVNDLSDVPAKLDELDNQQDTIIETQDELAATQEELKDAVVVLSQAEDEDDDSIIDLGEFEDKFINGDTSEYLEDGGGCGLGDDM